MKNTFKRIAAIALAVLMCVSAMVPAFAADNACPGADRTHTAANCDYEVAGKQEASCDVPGFVTGKCKTCKVVFSVSQTEALGHTWDAAVSASCDTPATRTCKVCKTTEDLGVATGHLYTAWEVTGGVCAVGERVTKTCVYCGDVKSENVGPDGHYFEMVSYIKPADCVTEGIANVKCVICGVEKEEIIEINTTKHKYVNWDGTDGKGTTTAQKELFKLTAEGKKDPNAKDATCVETGTHSVLCLDCGDVQVVVDAIVPHTYMTDDTGATYFEAAVLPTCYNAGNIKYTKCTECRAYFDEFLKELENGEEDVVIPAIHDNYSNKYDGVKEFGLVITAEKAPKDAQDGYRRYGCPVCGVKTSTNAFGWENDSKKDGLKNVEVAIPAAGDHVYYNDITTDAQKLALLATLNGKSVEAYEEDLKNANTTVAKVWDVMFKVTGKVQYNGAFGAFKGIYQNYKYPTCEEAANLEWLCLNYYIDYAGNVQHYCAASKTSVSYLSGEGFDAKGHDYDYLNPTSASVKATCYDDGVNVYKCKNCTETVEEVLPKLGHDYKTLTEADVKTNNFWFVDDSYNDVNLTMGNYVPATCVDDGNVYTYCKNGCEDRDGKFFVLVSAVEADGESHVWKYRDFKYDGVTYGETTTVTAAEFIANLPCGATVSVQRHCSKTGVCDKAESIETVTVTGPEHTYIDTTSKAVLNALENLAFGQKLTAGQLDATLTGSAAAVVVAECVRAGNCEETQRFQLICTNRSDCGYFTYTEITGDYAQGHVKTYFENTASAGVHGVTGGYSNEWICTNDFCKDAKWIDDGDGEVEYGEALKYGSDVKYGNGHQVWNEKTEKFVSVTYKDVPDENVSGAANITKALEVEAPVDADGNVIRYVEIPGTTLVWVYKYSEKTNHTELKTVKAGLYCVECNYISTDAKAPAASIVYGNATHTSWYTVTIAPDCDTNGRTTKTCKDCFYSYQTAWVDAAGHNFKLLESDGTLVKDHAALTAAYNAIVAAGETGYAYVAPTCTRAGYVIDKCTKADCGETVVLPIKATGHHDSEGRLVANTCLDTASSKYCRDCNVKFNFDHIFDANNVCVECGETK